MKKFQYYIPTRVLFGQGALGGLHKAGIPGKKGLIVISSGKSTKANGYLARVEEQLELAGCEHVLFDKILKLLLGAVYPLLFNDKGHNLFAKLFGRHAHHLTSLTAGWV